MIFNECRFKAIGVRDNSVFDRKAAEACELHLGRDADPDDDEIGLDRTTIFQ